MQCTFIHQYFDFIIDKPYTPIPLSKIQSAVYFLVLYCMINVHRTFFSFFWLGSNPMKYISPCRALILRFILVYTQLIRVRTKYIIIYIMKKHPFTLIIMLIDWFHTTLHTWLLVNITKRMEKALILRCTFLQKHLEFLLIIPLHTSLFKNVVGCLFFLC